MAHGEDAAPDLDLKPQGNIPAGAGTNTGTTLQPGAVPGAVPQNGVGAQVPTAGAPAVGAGAATGAGGGGALTAYAGSDEGEDLYSAVAKLAPFEFFKALTMETGESLKISCFIVDKFNIKRDSALFLKYGQDVKSISIENNIHSFGTKAKVLVNDGAGALSSILEGQMHYYFVICILNLLDEAQGEGGTIEEGIVYQPYIFEMESVELMSPDNQSQKVFSITLCDIISSVLKKVSYGNLLLEQPSFPNLNNFGEVYTAIIDYAALIVNLLHDKKYKIPRDLILGGSINDSINPIIKDIVLKDVTIDTPLYSLMNRVYSMAAREIEVPGTFSKKAEVKGMVLTPLFLNDEWEDLEGYYRTYYSDHDSDAVDEELSYSDAGKISINAKMFRRNLYLKHMQMPFQLAFCEEKPRIYETFNPKMSQDGTLHPDELIFNPLNGYTVSTLKDVVEIPVDAEMSSLLWKNICLMADGAGGSANALIYYNWIFEYYKNVYLNYENNFIRKQFNKETVPPIDPYFLRLEKLNLVGGDKEKFSKINSVTARIRSTDPVKEAFWHVGRGVKAYVFLNSLFGFKAKGNIIRHPGEIIKINYGDGKPDGEMLTTGVPIGGTNTIENGYVMAYITQVIHQFNGSEYIDIIHATKICSVSEPKEETGSTSGTNSNTESSTPSTQTPAENPVNESNAPTPSTGTPAPTNSSSNNTNSGGQ